MWLLCCFEAELPARRNTNIHERKILVVVNPQSICRWLFGWIFGIAAFRSSRVCRLTCGRLLLCVCQKYAPSFPVGYACGADASSQALQSGVNVVQVGPQTRTWKHRPVVLLLQTEALNMPHRGAGSAGGPSLFATTVCCHCAV